MTDYTTGWTVDGHTCTTDSNGVGTFTSPSPYDRRYYSSKDVVDTKSIDFKQNEIKNLQRKLNKKNVNANDKNIILNLISTLTNEINDEKRKQLYEKKQ